LWEAIEPLLPKEQLKPKGGRPRVPDRAALAGIVFVLRTGCPWRLLPKELCCGSGTTCWRRLRDWEEAGVLKRLHDTLLNWLGDEAAIDWSRASVDSLSVRAKRGAN
jgi:transposase